MWGITMGGEGTQRKMANEVIGSKVEGETVPFSFPRTKRNGEEVRASALVYIQSLEDHVLQLLDKNKMLVYHTIVPVVYILHSHHRTSQITCDGALPDDEIWVKLGGDKCGTSMKVHAQLLHSKHFCL